MPNTRKIIRAFLASPGDLQEERAAIREVVTEFNESWANALGYQVELIGWEETVAGFGRPQNLINKDLDSCDLFIGMIWKRWGTPPDHTGEYSSGFEEEFKRSVKRCEKTGTPEISLFFKTIPEDFMKDPGKDLKKVVSFREQIIADKKILFQSFSNIRDIESFTRKCITAYVNRVRTEDEFSESDDLRAKSSQDNISESKDVQAVREGSPLSSEGVNFLEDFVNRIGLSNSLDTLSSSDIARFRLLANSITKDGNDAMNLGVHDINILFSASLNGMTLGQRENRSLVRLGFHYFATKNVPLWRWYSKLSKSASVNPAIISSFADVAENEKVGAISVLTSLAIELPDSGIFTRNEVVKSWFADDVQSRIRTAGLEYLAKLGTSADLEIVKKEYERSDYSTSRVALECMISILLRSGKTQAARQLVVESQFENIDNNLLELVLKGLDELDSSLLRIALDHRNFQVRLSSMKLLCERGELDVTRLEQLTEDVSAVIRFEAITALQNHGKSLTEEDVKKILVHSEKKSTSALLGLGSGFASKETGEELFAKYQLVLLKNLSETELKNKIDKSFIYDEPAYFALAEKSFRKRVSDLRSDVDDKFKRFFCDRIRCMEIAFSNTIEARELLTRIKGLEDLIRKNLTRQGLNLLCVAERPEDLNRIRVNLRDGYSGMTAFDAKYLAKFGEWSDISLLANPKQPKVASTLAVASTDSELQYQVARSIISISKKSSISDLLSLEMPPGILKNVIGLCVESRYAKISQSVLFLLFNHESEAVRNVAAIMAVRSFSVKQIKSILHEYVMTASNRYYNVVHWLDLGASMSRDDVRLVAQISNK